MNNIKLVKTLKAKNNLDKNTPNFLLGEELFLLLMLDYFLVEVSII